MHWVRFSSAGFQPALRPWGAATTLLLLFAFVGIATPPRNADLDRIRGEIARMRSRLSDVRAQTQTAERELEEVDLELGIRTR